MKKVLAVIIVAVLIVSCNKTSDKKSIEIESTPKIAKNTPVIDESKFTTYEHNQSLDFTDGGFDIKVLNSPFETNTLYTIQQGDVITVTNVIELNETKKVYLKVKIPSGEYGYIGFGNKNPYHDGEYSYIETLNVDGQSIDILKISQKFEVSDGVLIKSLPTDNAENIHEITHAEGADYYQAIAITKDYKWVKIQINEYTGWVPSDSLTVGRGGPTINTPENVIRFELIDSNFI